MDGENKFWICVWLIVLAAVITLISSITVYNVSHDAYVSKALGEGKTAQEVFCAFNAGGETKALCVVAK